MSPPTSLNSEQSKLRPPTSRLRRLKAVQQPTATCLGADENVPPASPLEKQISKASSTTKKAPASSRSQSQSRLQIRRHSPPSKSISRSTSSNHRVPPLGPNTLVSPVIRSRLKNEVATKKPKTNPEIRSRFVNPKQPALPRRPPPNACAPHRADNLQQRRQLHQEQQRAALILEVVDLLKQLQSEESELLVRFELLGYFVFMSANCHTGRESVY